MARGFGAKTRAFFGLIGVETAMPVGGGDQRVVLRLGNDVESFHEKRGEKE